MSTQATAGKAKVDHERRQMVDKIDEEFRAALRGCLVCRDRASMAPPTLRHAYLSAIDAGYSERVALKHAAVEMHRQLARLSERVCEIEMKRPAQFHFNEAPPDTDAD